MAANRERRANAGNRIAKLLDEEEEDEFYKTAYNGGFHDTADDRDYITTMMIIVDSDFSIDENDEPVSDREEESAPKRKREGRQHASVQGTRGEEEETPVKAPKRGAAPCRAAKVAQYTAQDSGRKSFRKTTAKAIDGSDTCLGSSSGLKRK
ncbi:hypothetical protein pipiens_019218, partial [Culex pipiens pipiens]